MIILEEIIRCFCN